MKVKTVIGDTVTMNDLHSDPLCDANFYPKILPSSIRQKLLLECQRTNQSELKMIVEIIIEHFEE